MITKLEILTLKQKREQNIQEEYNLYGEYIRSEIDEHIRSAITDGNDRFTLNISNPFHSETVARILDEYKEAGLICRYSLWVITTESFIVIVDEEQEEAPSFWTKIKSKLFGGNKLS